ncbi:7700_t:CDS:2, partial [Scutellospora calospora]
MEGEENFEQKSLVFTEGSNESLTNVLNMTNFSLLSLTSEILAEICENLSPKDLYTLTRVCKKLRHFLWATSGFTQQIWRNSRISMTSQKSPPKGMSEQQYIWLKELGTSCQVCRVPVNKFDRCLVWEFKRVCCSSCLSRETKSSEVLKNQIPENVLSCLPNIDNIKPLDFAEACLVTYTLPGSRCENLYYWASDVYKAYNEYKTLNENEKEEWIKNKKAEVDEFNREIEEIKEKFRTECLQSLV